MVKITRTAAGNFAVETDTLMSDGSYKQDGCCRLQGNVLRSHEQRGFIRVGGLMRITLGPASLAMVQALDIHDSVTFGQ